MAHACTVSTCRCSVCTCTYRCTCLVHACTVHGTAYYSLVYISYMCVEYLHVLLNPIWYTIWSLFCVWWPVQLPQSKCQPATLQTLIKSSILQHLYTLYNSFYILVHLTPLADPSGLEHGRKRHGSHSKSISLELSYKCKGTEQKVVISPVHHTQKKSVEWLRALKKVKE